MDIFDYDNVLLLPRRCRVDSRSQCDTSVVFGGRTFRLPARFEQGFRRGFFAEDVLDAREDRLRQAFDGNSSGCGRSILRHSLLELLFRS